nr:hypothetical protein [Tanacetum cinerariifolium]
MMNMLNNKCRTSFAKPEFHKKSQRANPHLYDIGCYNDNLVLMLGPDTDEVIRLEKESRSKLSNLIRPFDYDKLNNLYDLFVPQHEKSSEQRYFLERSRLSHINVNYGKSKESFNKQTTLLEKPMDESIPLDKLCQSSLEIFKVKTCLNEEMVVDLRYFNSLKLEVDSLRSQLETQKTKFLNEIDRLSREYYYADHMNADLKAPLQDKSIAISELKKLIEKLKGKSVDTNLNAKTLNVKSDSAMCDKCVLHDKHNMCVLNSVAKPIKKTVSSESNKKPRNFTRKLYEHVSKTCSWWYSKFTPSGYKWKPNSVKENVNPNLVEIVLFIVDSGCSKHMTGNLKLLISFMEKFLGTVKFGNDQIAPILGYGDLVQGAVMINRVYYVEGLNHNLFFFGSRGTNLYSIKLQDTSSPNPIFLVAKATSSQAWLWHRYLSHLNFDTINLLSKNDIVVGLPKLKFV